MKKLLMGLVAVFTLSTTLPAFAGDDAAAKKEEKKPAKSKKAKKAKAAEGDAKKEEAPAKKG